MSGLGEALANLRTLAGLGQAEVARGVSLDIRSIRKAERGGGDPGIILKLCTYYGVDATRLLTGYVTSLDTKTSIFLFSGDLRDLSQGDLPILTKTLQRARAVSASPAGAQALRRRLECVPSSPTGPDRIDAAIQGHILARELRAVLEIHGAPIGRMGELLEGLAIHACLAPLSTTSLRAVAILDMERAGAAIVVNSSQDLRIQVQRVAIAHEICHLVYDLAVANACTVTLEDTVVPPQVVQARRLKQGRLDGAGSSGKRMKIPHYLVRSWAGPRLAASRSLAQRHSRVDEGKSKISDLRESRARGFAAEFLLPLQGLIEKFGKPARITSVEDARQMIQEARSLFGTPWEIAANHLYNTKFIAATVWSKLRWDASSDSECEMENDISSSSILIDTQTPADTLAFAARERARSEDIEAKKLRSITANKHISHYSTMSEETPSRAAIELAKLLDKAFVSGQSALVLDVLNLLDPQNMNGDTTVGVLANLRKACEVRGSPFNDVYHTRATETIASLAHRWKWAQEDIDDAKGILL